MKLFILLAVVGLWSIIYGIILAARTDDFGGIPLLAGFVLCMLAAHRLGRVAVERGWN